VAAFWLALKLSGMLFLHVVPSPSTAVKPFQILALDVRRRKLGIPSSGRAVSASFPQRAQPLRALRANNSIFGSSGYMCSIIS
jgi:hypothetical protein